MNSEVLLTQGVSSLGPLILFNVMSSLNLVDELDLAVPKDLVVLLIIEPSDIIEPRRLLLNQVQ